MRWTPLLGSSLVLTLALTGCSSSAGPMDAGGNDTAAPVDGGMTPDVQPATDGPREGGLGSAVTAACGHLAMVRCTKLDTCTLGFSLARSYGTVADCVARQQMACINSHLAPMTATSPAATEACAAAIEAESCSDWRSQVAPGSCDPPHGPLADAAPCVAAAQCQSGFCRVRADQLCGVCAPEPAVGAACGANGLGCGRVLVCANSRCAIPGAMDVPCDADHPCLGGLGCVATTPTAMTGTCQPLGTALGDSCGFRMANAPQCDGANGLTCNSMSQCGRLATAAAGERCGFLGMGMGFSVCTGGAVCPASAMMGTVTMCVPPAADGMPCDTAAGPGCNAPSRCVLNDINATDGVCRAFDPNACAM